MENEIVINLINKAKEAANKNFCCKHSKFTVGVALLDSNGKIFTGFNIENDGIQSICAERSTLCVALNEMSKDFKCMAVVGKNIDDYLFIKTLPCGYCRQFLSEYCNKDFIIYTFDDKEQKLYKYTLEELLPENFSL